jgi:hypothetical protein
MDEKEREKLKHILKRLYMTKPGETICLAYWEINLLLLRLEELEGE